MPDTYDKSSRLLLDKETLEYAKFLKSIYEQIAIRTSDLCNDGINFETDTVGTTTYLGLAKMGEATSAATWQIIRIVVTAGNVSMRYADNDDNFDNVWDNRTGLSY